MTITKRPVANTMQKFSGQGNVMTQSASNIIRSGLTRNCKKQCPPNSAFERCVQFVKKSGNGLFTSK